MTKIEDIEARHERDAFDMFGKVPGAKGPLSLEAGWDAYNDRAYLLAEVKRLSAPVTDEEIEAASRSAAIADDGSEQYWRDYLCPASAAITAFLKGRMS